VQGGTSTGRVDQQLLRGGLAPAANSTSPTNPTWANWLASSLLASATYQSLPGPEITANRGHRGRNATVPLIKRAKYRWLSRGLAGRAFRFGSRRLMANVDLYNLFNTSPVLAQNNTYGANWQQPAPRW
jgi:hypothetical protein